jgi:hypothetical protein
MKNGVILARKSTWRSRLDLNYLDETSDRKISTKSENHSQTDIGLKLKQFGDYASKETLGQVHAGGFLHDLVRVNPDGSSTAPSKLTNAERKQRISDAWFQHIRKFPTSSDNPVIQHRMVFSMSNELHDNLVGAGLNPDRVLQSAMKKVMGKFAEHFHPTDSIGYAYGIHHDTDNLHVHVALCPRSAKGAYVGCSTSRTNTGGHKKQMDFLRKCFMAENKRWSKILNSPQKLQQAVSKRLDSDKLVFSPKLNYRQLAVLRASQSYEATRLQQLYQGIRNLETSLGKQREAVSAQRDIRFVGRLMGYRPSKVQKAVTKISTDVQRRSIREMQKTLFQLKREYCALHKRYTHLYGFQSYGHRNAQYPYVAHRPKVAVGTHTDQGLRVSP